MTEVLLANEPLFRMALLLGIFGAMAPSAIAYTWLGHAGREALAGDAPAIRYGLPTLGLPPPSPSSPGYAAAHNRRNTLIRR